MTEKQEAAHQHQQDAKAHPHQEDAKAESPDSFGKAKAHPTKAASVPPLQAEALDLLDKIRESAKDFRDHVADLRSKVAAFNAKIAGERLSPQDEAALDGIMTEVESALNKLDPDSPITV